MDFQSRRIITQRGNNADDCDYGHNNNVEDNYGFENDEYRDELHIYRLKGSKIILRKCKRSVWLKENEKKEPKDGVVDQ